MRIDIAVADCSSFVLTRLCTNAGMTSGQIDDAVVDEEWSTYLGPRSPVGDHPIVRRRNSSNSGTVKAVSPWEGL